MGEQDPVRWTKGLGDDVSVILQREFTADRYLTHTVSSMVAYFCHRFADLLLKDVDIFSFYVDIIKNIIDIKRNICRLISFFVEIIMP